MSNRAGDLNRYTHAKAKVEHYLTVPGTRTTLGPAAIDCRSFRIHDPGRPSAEERPDENLNP